MIQTFDFVFQLQKNDALRNRVYKFMVSEQDEELNIGGWHLLFDNRRRWCVVTRNGMDDSLVKFIDGEIEYESLCELIEAKRTTTGRGKKSKNVRMDKPLNIRWFRD